jgi:lysophospholipase L1-like esterase
VVNAGISGNKVVSDRFDGSGPSTDSRGVSAANRLDRDVLAQPDARTVIVFEGINDLRGETTADQVIAGLRQIAARAHAHGLRVVGGTITPCAGWPDCTAAVEAKRQAVNAFLRAGGGTRLAARAEGSEGTRPSAGTVPADGFDAIIDFDAVIRDPADPTRIRPDYDSGDHLHPGDAGYRAMAASIDLRALVNRR